MPMPMEFSGLPRKAGGSLSTGLGSRTIGYATPILWDSGLGKQGIKQGRGDLDPMGEMGNGDLEVDHGDTCAAIGLVGGFEALDLGMAMEVVVNTALELAGAVAVDDPEGTTGMGDRFFENRFGFGDTHTPQVDGIAAGADGWCGRGGLGSGYGVLGFGFNGNFGFFALERFDVGKADSGFHEAEADGEFVVVIGGGEDFGGLTKARNADAIADLGFESGLGLHGFGLSGWQLGLGDRINGFCGPLSILGGGGALLQLTDHLGDVGLGGGDGLLNGVFLLGAEIPFSFTQHFGLATHFVVQGFGLG